MTADNMAHINMDEVQPVIMIGGQSRRMGRDKASIVVDDMPMGVRLFRLLETVTGRDPWVCGQGNLDPGKAVKRVHDRQVGAGPLSGLLGVFDVEPQCDLLVVAVDLMLFNTDALIWLLTQKCNRCALWPRFPQRDRGEPLAALYRPSARVHLEHSWQMGKRSLMRALEPGVVSQPAIPASLALAFTNVNTPEQMRVAMRMLGGERLTRADRRILGQ